MSESRLVPAREKVGKSLLALGLSLAIARGEEQYAGLRTEPGRVVYIDAENGIAETHRRIRRLSAMPTPPDRFQYLALGEQRFQLDDPDALDLLAEEVVDAYRPDLIVFDSFRSLWTGDENNPREVTRVLDPLRNFLRGRGVAGLILHHANAKGALRGSTGIPASVENLTTLERGRGDERKLTQLPSRFGEVLDRPRHYRITPRGPEAMAPLDLVATDRPRPAADELDRTGERDLTLDVERLLADGTPRGVRAIARELGYDPTSRRVRNALDALVGAKTLQRDPKTKHYALRRAPAS